MGLDRTRLLVERRLGVDAVDPNTLFSEGDVLHWSADGWKQSDDADAVVIRGIAGINKQTTQNGVIIGEEVVLNAEDVTPLAHGNVIDGSQKVTDETGATTYTETTDYLFVDANGTIARVATGSIGDGDTVLVSYTYQKTQIEIEEDPGLGINNSLDETIGSGNVAVFQGNCLIATTQYDTSQDYAVNDVLYDNGDGLLTSDDTGSPVAVGSVKSPPSAQDPYLLAELSL